MSIFYIDSVERKFHRLPEARQRCSNPRTNYCWDLLFGHLDFITFVS